MKEVGGLEGGSEGWSLETTKGVIFSQAKTKGDVMDRVFLVHEFSKRANPWLATLILCLGLGRLNGIFARCVHCFYQDAVRFSGRSWL